MTKRRHGPSKLERLRREAAWACRGLLVALRKFDDELSAHGLPPSMPDCDAWVIDQKVTQAMDRVDAIWIDQSLRTAPKACRP
jgi:hypothetical protein